MEKLEFARLVQNPWSQVPFPILVRNPLWLDIMVQEPSSLPTAIFGAFFAKIMTSAIWEVVKRLPPLI
jgi:hypothetical protein